MNRKIILGIIIIAMIFLTFKAALAPQSVSSSSYTASSETHCTNGVCTTTLYSGVMYAQDSAGDWVNASDVLSITKNQDDITFNYNGIQGQFSVTFEAGVIYNDNYYSMAEVKQLYPQIEFEFPSERHNAHRKYSVNITNIPAQLQDNLQSITLTYKEHSGFTLDELTSDTKKWIIKGLMQLGYDDLLESGFNFSIDIPERRIYIGNISNNIEEDSLYLDPTVQLQSADIDILEDSSVDPDDPSGNRGSANSLRIGHHKDSSEDRTYIKWNTTELQNKYLVDVIMCGKGAYLKNSSVNHVYGWYNLSSGSEELDEESITWNNQPCGTGTQFTNSTYCNLTAIGYLLDHIPSTGWACANITSFFGNTHSENNETFGIENYLTGGVYGTQGYIWSKEVGSASNRPYLQFVYYTDSPEVSLDDPPNGRVENDPIVFNCSATTSLSLANASLYGNWTGAWHLNETVNVTGKVNSSYFTKTIGTSDGNYIWNCEFTNNESTSSFASSNRTFIYDATKPVLNITFPANNTRHLFSTLDLNYTVEDLNVDTCWYEKDQNGTNITIGGCDNTSVEYSIGMHNITLWVNDSAGNLGNSSFVNFTVSVDTTDPTITILDPASGESITSSNQDCTLQNITIDYQTTDNEEVDTCWYSVEHSVNGFEIENFTINNCENTSFIPSSGCAVSPNYYRVYMYVNDTSANNGTTSSDFYLTWSTEGGGGAGGGGDIITIANTTGKLINLNFIDTYVPIFLPFRDEQVLFEAVVPTRKKIQECTVTGNFTCNISSDQTSVTIARIIKAENKIMYLIQEEITLIDEFEEVTKRPLRLRVINLNWYFEVRENMNLEALTVLGNGFVKIEDGKVIGIRLWWITVIVGGSLIATLSWLWVKKIRKRRWRNRNDILNILS